MFVGLLQVGSFRQRAPGAGGRTLGPPPCLSQRLPEAREQEQVSAASQLMYHH